MILQSLAGLPAFLVYFCTAIIAVVAYLFVYTRVTAHNEFDLIRANEPAAAIALGLSLLGFVLPLVSAIAHSANVWDCLIWAAIALIVQIIVYFLVRVPVPNLSKRIAGGELAAAIWLGLSSLAAGALNAACMIYHGQQDRQGFRQAQTGLGAGDAAARSPGEALRSRRPAADGYICGRQRRLHADAEPELRATTQCAAALAAAKQRR